MPNLAAVLKTEISRLARRATRPLHVTLKKDVAALKRALARQKRLTAQLAKDSARLLADLNSRLALPPTTSQDALKRARISPRLIRGQRSRLGLSREAFAKLVGVSGGTIFGWEGGKSKPRAAARAALVAVRKLGKREARARLEVLAGVKTERKAPGRKNGKKQA